MYKIIHLMNDNYSCEFPIFDGSIVIDKRRFELPTLSQAVDCLIHAAHINGKTIISEKNIQYFELDLAMDMVVPYPLEEALKAERCINPEQDE